MLRAIGIRCCCVTSLLLAVAVTVADEPPSEPVAKGLADRLPSNLDTPTLGGKQFWTDELVHGSWRIQRNVLTGHFRLLDDRNVRRSWGTYEQCWNEYQRCKQRGDIATLRPKVVIVLHGLVRSRESMESLSRYLQEHGDYSVLNVSYASSQSKISDHAAALGRMIGRLEGVTEINFVAHSLGNLVVRHYLGDHTHADRGLRPDPRIHRIVMIAPPNNGTELANRFRKNLLFQTVWGESGQELAEDWTALQKHLAVPQCPFGVIAGGKGDDQGLNPLLAGDDDFVVSVAETRLVGASDFALVTSPHGIIMDNRKVQEMTLRFLEHGYFQSEQERRPILPTHPASP